jgi:undecaprenyl-diphosphatase
VATRQFRRISLQVLQNVGRMLFQVPASIGLPALAGLVLGESAGLPIPGETALIVAGGLAHDGQLSIWAVIAVAAMSAIVGDMIGYWVGRRGGRKLLLREGRFSAHRHAAVEKADKYFEKYGLVTVFFARFVPGVRVVGAIAAGTTQMRFRNFAIANALGCWAWATTVATIAYIVGPGGAVVMIIIGFGVAGVGLVSAAVQTRRAEGASDTATATVEADAEVEADVDPSAALATFASDDDESVSPDNAPANTARIEASGLAAPHVPPIAGSAAAAIGFAACNRLP